MDSFSSLACLLTFPELRSACFHWATGMEAGESWRHLTYPEAGPPLAQLRRFSFCASFIACFSALR